VDCCFFQFFGVDNVTKPRLAASSFLNSAPLIWSFSNGSQKHRVQLTDAVPARCADLLAADAVDFALVPVIESQRIENVKLVPGVCVGSRERVRSVVLVSRLNNLKKIKTVALDESSRTSATLVKIIFQEFLGTEPRWAISSPDVGRMLRENDAALIIGDPGMLFARASLHVWDMAELWREHTGLGFIFAMWMGQKTANVEIADFVGARDEGLRCLEEIVSEYTRKTPMTAEEIRDYLTRNIVFEPDDELNRGMQLYFQLAAKLGLITRVKSVDWLMR
jgi:chorismate dehydratase